MLVASVMNAAKTPDAEFAYGSGHIDPVKAVDPGLVYESLTEDYIKMLCSIGFDTTRVRLITKDNSSCPTNITGTPKDLNYPSMAAQVATNKPFAFKFPRTVTNVGPANSTYKPQVTNDSRIKIDVVPSVLSFGSVNEKKTFTVSVTGVGLPANTMVSAQLVWSDDDHIVRSPIVVYTITGPK